METAIVRKGLGLTLYGVGLVVLAAFAAGVDPTPDSIVTSGAAALVTSVLTVAQSTWPIWIPVVAVMIGIGIFMRIVRHH